MVQHTIMPVTWQAANGNAVSLPLSILYTCTEKFEIEIDCYLGSLMSMSAAPWIWLILTSVSRNWTDSTHSTHSTHVAKTPSKSLHPRALK